MEAELKGLAKAIINDEVVENSEILLLHQWLSQTDIPRAGPLRDLRTLIDRVCADGTVTSAERAQLLSFLKAIARRMPPQEKGFVFEKYVLSRFNKYEYRLHEWRSDKYLRGWGWPTSNSRPDLELEHIQTGTRFAVECKYQTAKPSAFLVWTTPKKLDNYIRHQNEKPMPVFIAIGLGGEPSNPSAFYVAPLKCMKYPDVTIEYLKQFQRDDGRLTLDKIKHSTMGCRVRATSGASPDP